MKQLFSVLAAGAILLGLSPTARAQTEVSLLAPNPIRGALMKVLEGFDGKTGYKLKLTLGKGLGTRRQIAQGEMFDVSILLPPFPEALASGNIDPKTATTIASLQLSLGVKKGSPKPDISTPKALKQTLLAAKTVAVVDPSQGSDGFNTREALAKLGVIDLFDSRIKLAPTASAAADLVAKGEADLCIFYMNEMDKPALDIVGLLPRQIAPPVKVVAFISTHRRDEKAAKALIDYLTSPEAEASYKKDGLLPIH